MMRAVATQAMTIPFQRESNARVTEAPDLHAVQPFGRSFGTGLHTDQPSVRLMRADLHTNQATEAAYAEEPSIDRARSAMAIATRVSGSSSWSLLIASVRSTL